MWGVVCRQCALTSNVGHAYSIAMIHQKLCMNFETFTSSTREEEWQTVSTERGHWATLYSHLEVLVYLSNIVGLEALKTLPSVPYFNISEDTEHLGSIDISKLKMQFYDKGLRQCSLYWTVIIFFFSVQEQLYVCCFH